MTDADINMEITKVLDKIKASLETGRASEELLLAIPEKLPFPGGVATVDAMRDNPALANRYFVELMKLVTNALVTMAKVAIAIKVPDISKAGSTR